MSMDSIPVKHWKGTDLETLLLHMHPNIKSHVGIVVFKAHKTRTWKVFQ